jgi:Family of unknown function (DUF5723)
MKRTILYIYLLPLLFVASVAHAQQELMLSQMPDAWQQSSLNPAYFPKEKRIVIGLPSVAIDAWHSGTLSYNDLFRDDNGTRVFDFGQIIEKLDPVNEVSYRQRIETASVGFRLPGPGKSAITLGHAIRLNSNITYTKELAQLFWEGNAQFIGQTIQVAPSTRTHDWHELSVGFSRSFGKLRVGAKVKYLAGISAFITDPQANKMSIYTNPDIYQLEMSTDYGFHSAGIISAIDTSGLGFDVVTGEFQNGFSGANSGLAFDLGFTYDITDKLTVHASAIDLGASMRWEAANYFHSKADYAYNGVTIPGSDIINGEGDLNFSDKLDTLNDIFQFSKITTNFSTAVPSRFFVGANYAITKRLQVATSLFHEQGNAENKTSFGVSAHFMPIKLIGIGLMYAVNDQSVTNIGAQLSLNPGPISFFVASDNLGGVFSPLKSPRVNVRTGLSIRI